MFTARLAEWLDHFHCTPVVVRRLQKPLQRDTRPSARLGGDVLPGGFDNSDGQEGPAGAGLLCLIGVRYVHIAGRVVGDTVRNAAKNPSKPAHTPVSHDDHEGLVRLSLLDQCLGGCTADGEVVDLQPLGSERNGSFTRDLFGVVCFRDDQLVAARSYDEGAIAAKGRHYMKRCSKCSSQAGC